MHPRKAQDGPKGQGETDPALAGEGAWGEGKQRPGPVIYEDTEYNGQKPSWELYCGRTVDCRRCWAQTKKDYAEHNRVSLLCHLLTYLVGCAVLGCIVAFFIWLGSSEMW